MNYDREVVFAFLEEDNTQRVYFRLKPLLCASGDMREEALKLWPDEGGLRIVPDKNEQCYFKDRMRELGSYCLMDLTPFPADANKIRTNKNYRPEKDERNQFILYSDAVKALPDDAFIEVVDGNAEDFAALAVRAVTPKFYIRAGEALFGPVIKSAPALPGPAAPSCGVLRVIPCPDGAVRSILCCAQAAPAPAADCEAADADSAALPIGKKLTIIDEKKDFQESLRDIGQPLPGSANLLKGNDGQPADTARPSLTGTPLFRGPAVRTSVPRPKNHVQEVVSSQWRAARYEPPAAPLPADIQLGHVENPVETACSALKSAWQMPEAQTQLTDCILSLTGLPAQLMTRMTSVSGTSPLQQALQNRLQELEAERLAALVQLDNAKENLEAFRRTVVSSLKEENKAEAARRETEKAAFTESIASLTAQLTALTAQRDALTQEIDRLHQALPEALEQAFIAARLEMPVSGIPLRMFGVPGQTLGSEEMVARIRSACQFSGLACDHNYALAFLALLATCPRFGVIAATPAAAMTLTMNVACALGWRRSIVRQLSAEQKPVFAAPPAGSTPLILETVLPSYAPLEGVTKLIMARTSAQLTRNAAYESDPWPIVPISVLPFIAEMPEERDGAPVSAASVAALAQDAPDCDATTVLAPILAQIPPLSGTAGRELKQFVRVCAAHMEGGLAVALDWAVLLWAVPQFDRSPKALSEIKPLLNEYPLSLAQLQT